MLEALNGQVWIEDEGQRRLLPTLPGKNCLIEMLKVIGTEAGKRRALDDLEVTRVALLARQAADEGREIRTV